MPSYSITKTYPHSLGLSCVFRQPYAKSHCRDPHGYALSFELKFSAHTLDENNWVIDFGSLKSVKLMLAERFDHRTILAHDDPALEDFQALYKLHGFNEILTLPAVGCEGFATYVANEVQDILSQVLKANTHRGLKLVSVECREHSGNSATHTL